MVHHLSSKSLKAQGKSIKRAVLTGSLLWSGWLLLVVGPHAQHLDGVLSLQHLIYQPMLDVDPPRVSTCKITDWLFVWRGRLKWIVGYNGQERPCVVFEAG
jgi:hypothetical protein